jgi:DNA-binding MarR family transcriptional regulator
MPTDNVVPLNAAPHADAAPEKHDKQPKDHRVPVRLTPKLANAWAAVPTALIQGAHRLRPHDGARGLNPTEVMVLIHLLDRKWDERMPFPAITTIAEQMGLKPRGVRAVVERMEKLGYLKRYPMANGGPNRYDLTGLFTALEKLMDEDVAKAEATDAGTGS